MSISVIGLGYVGLSLLVLLAQKFKVHAVDIDSDKVDMVSAGSSPIDDPDITAFLEGEPLDLTATTDFDTAVVGSDKPRLPALVFSALCLSTSLAQTTRGATARCRASSAASTTM